jgi:hypothetical protein
LAGPTEKDALRRCCAPEGFIEGLAARAMRRRTTPRGDVE